MIPILKLCVVGDDGIGKEAFIKLFTSQTGFLKARGMAPKLILGVDFYIQKISINTDKGIVDLKIQLWEFKGKESFKFVHPSYFEGTKGILLFFDLANRGSFLHLTYWISLIPEAIRKEIPILLVGNKSDPERFALSPKELDDFIRKFKLYYIETSTSKKEGIFDSFYCITSLMVGVDIHSKHFLSEKVIYRPSISPLPNPPSTTTLTPQDLHNLTQQLIIEFEKNKLEIKIKEDQEVQQNMDGVAKANTALFQKSDFICDTALSILHISDIQEGRFGIKEDISGDHEAYSNYLADLKSKLEIIHRKNKIDMIVISGDLASTGAKEEYDNLTNEFVPILNKIFIKGKNKVPKDRWIIVPGNHDVEWDKGKARFNNFVQFCQDNGFFKYQLNNPQSIYSKIIGKDINTGNTFGIIGLNSCLDIIDENSRNESNISKSYFSTFSKDWDNNFRELPKIMVCHHTLHTIKGDKFDHALNVLRDNNVLLSLAGDIHKSDSTADEISRIRCIPAGTISAKKSEREFGIDAVSRQFNLINLNLQSGYVKWYTYILEGTWREIKNHSFYLDHPFFSKRI